MKEKGSMPSKIISGNWVLKGKRKKVPCGTDISAKKEDASVVSPKSSASAKCRQIRDIRPDRSSSKRKGNDGYYYECVICDLGGDLLCCERCPRTYHLECLDPPLKSIPNGKWECSYCIHGSDTSELIRHQGMISKRARTKLLTQKSKADSKSSSSVKLCQFLGGTVHGKKRSSTKGKSSLSHEVHTKKKLDSSEVDLSCSDKPGQLICGTSMDGLLSAAESGENKNKSTSLEKEIASDSAAMETAVETKSSSAVEEASCLSKGVILEQNNGRIQRKSNLSSKIRFSREHLISALGVSSNSRKRKHKISRDESNKKFRTSNGKPPLSIIDKHKLETESGSVKLQKKSATVRKRISHSLEDAGSKSATSSQAVKKPAGPSNHIDKGDRADKRAPVEDYFFEEALQVDRILGCRILDHPGSSDRNSDMVASSNASGSGAQDILGRLPGKNPSSDTLEVENHSDTRNTEERSNDEKHIHNDIAVNKLQVYQRSVTKDCNQQNEKEIVETSAEGMLSTSKDGKARGKTLLVAGNLSYPCLIGDETDIFVGDTSAVINKIQQPSLAESAVLSEEVLYEFLVKWAGKSHIHDSWVPETILKVRAKRKLDNYKAKYGTTAMNLCEDRWLQPQRVVSVHASKDGIAEAFIKWSGLPYDECTWEKVDEPVIQNSLQLFDLYNCFERQALENDGHKDSSVKKGDRPLIEIPTLVEQPVELKSGNLFPHQLEALNWLRKCWHRSKNVILADEMGLGKTVSACAFLSSLYFEFKVKLPCLVLVPLSTMPNWMAEFASWAPGLNVVEYHGCAKARTLIRQYEWHGSYPHDLGKRTASYKFNVLLTTYEMVLADSSYLRGIPWEVLIVDEGHRLKNSSSKLFSLLNAFSFQHRVLLTGTPLQNNIGELYNLLNFLQPASFPSLSSFEEKFNDLTTTEKVEELKKLVVPHMLRRLKKDAMQNIPPKTERMVPVELSSVQAEYYRAMLTKNYQILRNIGKGIPQQSMLNIVMQLRKVCNHPYLIPGTEPESGSVEFLQEMRIKASAKLTVLHSMLKILFKEGHRVLIFSQMTKLLDILEDYLSVEFGPKSFERVDGSVSVSDRQAAIARFNQDKSRFVFLLSTRSCGLGINLATADTVIIYDSDFNPHADIQAMNRAHRIGQSNRLLVYRLVVRASVEERILQLARKKLMLDQLFVNKSGSQKEVEDILRWGTEELFSDSCGKDVGENDANKDEAIVDTENKSRRKTGSLGDVYKDKCTEGSNKILWDENAISKLLDRSTLQFGSPDNSEADLENDMLGSVKALEWNDEPMDEEGRTDAPTANDASAPHSDRKDDNLAVGPEENEWDRLLRIRWEKYQSEEEASLGRGKRLRKAVSYREVYAPHLSEALSESGGDDDPEPEPEPEPEREYTQAGRALKAKYARLRARQKERLATRKAFAESLQFESLPHLHSSDVTARLPQSSREKSKVDDRVDETEFRRSKSELTQKVRKLSKQRVSVIQNSPSKALGQSTSEPISNLLPVLGLCAPNAPQAESSHRNISRSYGKESRSMRRSDTLSHAIPCLETYARMDVEGPQTASFISKLPETSPEIHQRNMRTCIADNHHPVSLFMPTIQHGKSLDTAESSRASSIGFLERMGLPNLRYNEKFLPKYPFVPNNLQSTHSDLLPSLSLGRDEFGSGAMQVPSTLPFFPNLKFSPQDMPNSNMWETETPPSLSLGQMPNAPSSLPENHRKVLENIMLRTGLGSTNFPKRKSKQDGWSEDELDSLWIGVRRHGQGSWDAVLRDPRLKFSKYKTSIDLASRWKVEQLKLFDGSPVSKSSKTAKSIKPALFPSISDGMMVRALHGSRLGGPFQFQTHLTDMKLGFGDVATNLHHFEPSFPAGLYENFVPFPGWRPERFPVNFAGDSSFAGPSDRPGTSSNLHMDPPGTVNAFEAVSSGPLGLIGQPGGSGSQQKHDDLSLSRCEMFPSVVDRTLNMWQSISSEVGKAEDTTPSLLPSLSNGFKLPGSKGKEAAAHSESSSSKEKLPHWLREAVSAPIKPADSELPSAVSAVAESIRLLYAEEKPRIPPFVAPGPPPFRPKDPRKSLKKKRKKKQQEYPLLRCTSHNVAEASLDGQGGALFPSSSYMSGSVSIPPLPPPFPLLPHSVCGSLEFSSMEPNLYMAPPNVNQLPSILNSSRKTSSGLTPSREVLQLVASCMAPGPNVPLTTLGMTTTSYHESNNIPLAGASDQEGPRAESPHHVQSGQQSDLDPSVSKDSSKTESDIAPAAVRAGAEDILSSEGTVSDDQTGDKEP